MESIRVVLADDHPVVLSGMQRAINSYTRGIAVVGNAVSVDELLVVLTGTPCDVLVLDYGMPDGRRPDGVTMIRSLRRHYPALPIVLHTAVNNAGLLMEAMEAGVAAVIEKSAASDELPKAIKRVRAGGRYISVGLRQRLDDITEGRQASVPAPHLSPAESRVVRMFCDGMTVKQIAAKLARSAATISRQKNEAMRKLGVGTTVELIDLFRSGA